MSFILTIEFHGLCAFARAGKNTEMDVFLVDAHGQSPGHHHPVPPHEPRLVVNIENLEPGDRGIFGANYARTPFGGWGWIDLGGYGVSILPDGNKAKSGALRLCSVGTGKEPCPDITNSRDFSWVPDLKRIAGKACKVLPNAWAARVRLTEGLLECASFASSDGQIKAFEFPHTKMPTRALASSVRYSLQASKRVTIRLVPIKDHKKEEKNLKLIGSNGAALVVSNLPGKLEVSKKGGEADHFAAYYDLLKPTPKKQPIPKAKPCGTGLENIETGRPCPQAQLS
jgi:hypothetical protein